MNIEPPKIVKYADDTLSLVVELSNQGEEPARVIKKQNDKGMDVFFVQKDGKELPIIMLYLIEDVVCACITDGALSFLILPVFLRRLGLD